MMQRGGSRVKSDARLTADKVKRAAELMLDEGLEAEFAAERFGVSPDAVSTAASRMRKRRMLGTR